MASSFQRLSKSSISIARKDLTNLNSVPFFPLKKLNEVSKISSYMMFKNISSSLKYRLIQDNYREKQISDTQIKAIAESLKTLNCLKNVKLQLSW